MEDKVEKETQEFWTWLQNYCKTGLVVRVVLHYEDVLSRGLAGHVGSNVLLFCQSGKEEDEVNSLSLWLDSDSRHSSQPVRSQEKITHFSVPTLCGSWENSRLDCFLAQKELGTVTSIPGCVIDTDVSNHWLVREELARAQGCLEMASTEEEAERKIFIKRLAGLRRKLGITLERNLKGVEKYINNMYL